MNKSIVLLSSSKERRIILEELGYNVIIPDKLFDTEKSEGAFLKANVEEQSRQIIERKFLAYESAGCLKPGFRYLIADTISWCNINGSDTILGKCKTQRQMCDFLELYSAVSQINILTSQYIVDAEDCGKIKKMFIADNAVILLINEKKENIITQEFKKKYLSDADYLNRAGGIKIDKMIDFGVKVKGNVQTIRGICPF